jgi:hypothetical protein
MPEKLPNIIRGRMTTEEKAEITRLATVLKKPMPGPIARRLNRHPATVKWYMLRQGLFVPPRRSIHRPYSTKTGVTRHPWTLAQDARLEELLIEGKNYRQAAEVITTQFNVPRNTHSCQVRAVMLAASER